MIRLTIGVISLSLNAELRSTLASLKSVPDNCEVVVQLSRATRSEIELFTKASDLPLHVLPAGDQGIYNGMNRIRAAALGEYLWFLNAGDHMHPDRTLEEILGHLRLPTCYGFQSEQVFEDDVYLRPSSRQAEPPFFRIGHQSTIYHRSAYSILEFDEQIPVSADVAFNEASFNRIGMQYIPIVLSSFQLGGLSNRHRLSDMPAFRGESLSLRLKFVLKACLRMLIGQRLTYRVLAIGKYDYRRR